MPPVRDVDGIADERERTVSVFNGLPLQSRLAAVADETELDAVCETERHLLYVACTRARDRLMVSGVRPASEFLQDLRDGPAAE